MFSKGRSTCASVSAFNLEAQPAQLDRLVRRISRPEGATSLINYPNLNPYWLSSLPPYEI
jgi:hypothetical protein